MSETKKPNKYQNFVDFIIKLIDKESHVVEIMDEETGVAKKVYKNATAAAAALKRADNPKLEYKSWEYLIRLNVDIENPNERLPYATIACAIAKAKAEQNGKTKIGAAIARCYEEKNKKGNEDDQAKAKLRRLLACDSIEEVCQVLRPLFSLIDSKAGIQLDYADLLKDLRWFYKDGQQTKARWAKNFYGYFADDNKDGNND